ncbi:hypothetical protein TRIP_E300048 [uncultured Spirochaetota bacterium]|nr:hypothetical protein TRIP_E300048 [uncultured Spirochaetota bacterium]
MLKQFGTAFVQGVDEGIEKSRPEYDGHERVEEPRHENEEGYEKNEEYVLLCNALTHWEKILRNKTLVEVSPPDIEDGEGV